VSTDLKQRADGRYEKVKTINGKRVAFYSREKTERAAIKDIERQLLAYREKEEKGIPFSEVASEWWEIAYETIASQSAKTYKPALRRAVERFGDLSVKEITATDISTFLAKLGKEGYAHRTVANQKVVISLILDHAIIQGYVGHNVCKSAVMPHGLKKNDRPPASTEDEGIAMQSADMWLFPFIAIYTGLRKGEILALQWKDIDFEKGLISVTKNVEHVGDKPRIKVPKTAAGFRLVPMPKPLYDRLLKEKGKAKEFIISDTGDSPLTNRRFQTLSKHFKEATGINCTAHQLRKSYATIAIEDDECALSPKSLQSIMGHSQISVTMDTYAKFREKALLQAKDRLDEIFEKRAANSDELLTKVAKN
jgi:integrase